MTWIDVEDVKKFTGVKPKHLKLKEEDELDDVLTEWILQSQDMITSYTHNDFKNGVPPAVRNICLRLTRNMVMLSIASRDTPITQPNEWTVQILDSKIFSQDLKDDLNPFVEQAVTGKSDKVFVYTVTGEDIE